MRMCSKLRESLPPESPRSKRSPSFSMSHCTVACVTNLIIFGVGLICLVPFRRDAWASVWDDSAVNTVDSASLVAGTIGIDASGAVIGTNVPWPHDVLSRDGFFFWFFSSIGRTSGAFCWWLWTDCVGVGVGAGVSVVEIASGTSGSSGGEGDPFGDGSAEAPTPTNSLMLIQSSLLESKIKQSSDSSPSSYPATISSRDASPECSPSLNDTHENVGAVSCPCSCCC
mmetsp:Transcript_2223/g.5790  ORF Transcript_2223/g.5790 Transcript_2223/m.5790 type:complete len:227 (-) Transcript_2223:46-726(-)